MCRASAQLGISNTLDQGASQIPLCPGRQVAVGGRRPRNGGCRIPRLAEVHGLKPTLIRTTASRKGRDVASASLSRAQDRGHLSCSFLCCTVSTKVLTSLPPSA